MDGGTGLDYPATLSVIAPYVRPAIHDVVDLYELIGDFYYPCLTIEDRLPSQNMEERGNDI